MREIETFQIRSNSWPRIEDMFEPENVIELQMTHAMHSRNGDTETTLPWVTDRTLDRNELIINYSLHKEGTTFDKSELDRILDRKGVEAIIVSKLGVRFFNSKIVELLNKVYNVRLSPDMALYVWMESVPLKSKGDPFKGYDAAPKIEALHELEHKLRLSKIGVLEPTLLHTEKWFRYKQTEKIPTDVTFNTFNGTSEVVEGIKGLPAMVMNAAFNKENFRWMMDNPPLKSATALVNKCVISDEVVRYTCRM